MFTKPVAVQIYSLDTAYDQISIIFLRQTPHPDRISVIIPNTKQTSLRFLRVMSITFHYSNLTDSKNKKSYWPVIRNKVTLLFNKKERRKNRYSFDRCHLKTRFRTICCEMTVIKSLNQLLFFQLEPTTLPIVTKIILIFSFDVYTWIALSLPVWLSLLLATQRPPPFVCVVIFHCESFHLLSYLIFQYLYYKFWIR